MGNQTNVINNSFKNWFKQKCTTFLMQKYQSIFYNAIVFTNSFISFFAEYIELHSAMDTGALFHTLLQSFMTALWEELDDPVSVNLPFFKDLSFLEFSFTLGKAIFRGLFLFLVLFTPPWVLFEHSTYLQKAFSHYSTRFLC